MGAVASLMYMHTQKNKKIFKGLILDSPFADFEEICKFYVKTNNFLSDMLLDWGMSAVNSITQTEVGLNIHSLKPVKIVRHQKTPAIFIGGKKDKIIPLA